MATTVLVAEDSRALSDLVALTLRSAGYVVVQACDGEEALDLVEAAGPDLILSDVHMPWIGGLELARRLKAHPRHRRIPLIALTSHDDRIEVMHHGFDGHLLKPLPLRLLADVVSRFLEAARLIAQAPQLA